MCLFNYSSQRVIRKTGTFYGKLNLVCRQGISRRVGVIQQQLSWLPLSCLFFLRGFLMVCVLWCMLVRVSVYLQIIFLSLNVVKSIRSANSAH